uniref:EF-hand domain-containing protein n=1 Tax=Tetraselmis sp. GSL018 TaxID=582737 RepID=A0A061R9K4_9CHLO
MDVECREQSESGCDEGIQCISPTRTISSYRRLSRSIQGMPSCSSGAEEPSEFCLRRSYTSFSRKGAQPACQNWKQRVDKKKQRREKDICQSVRKHIWPSNIGVRGPWADAEDSSVSSRHLSSLDIRQGFLAKNRPSSQTSFDLGDSYKRNTSRKQTLSLKTCSPRKLEEFDQISPPTLAGRPGRRLCGASLDNSGTSTLDTQRQVWPNFKELRDLFETTPASVADTFSTTTFHKPPRVTFLDDVRKPLSNSNSQTGVASAESTAALPKLLCRSKPSVDPRQRAALFERIASEIFDDSSKEEERLMMKLQAVHRHGDIADDADGGNAEAKGGEETQTGNRCPAQVEEPGPSLTERKQEASKFARLVRKVSAFQQAQQRKPGAGPGGDPPEGALGVSLPRLGRRSSSRRAISREVEQTAEDVRLERRIEAVFSSFALCGAWEPNRVVVPQEPCKIGFRNFTRMCAAANLTGRGPAAARELHKIFAACMDKDTGLVDFQQLLLVLPELARAVQKPTEHVMEALLSINQEGHLWIHSSS